MNKYKQLVLMVSLGGFFITQGGVANADNIVSADELVNQLRVVKTRSFGKQVFGKKEGRSNLSSIQFEYNSSQLTEDGRLQVDQLAKAMQTLSRDDFQVIGHTDASGSEQYNLSLSQKRANTVYDYLVSTHGINPERIQSVGKGENALANDEDPNSALNRRVEAVNIKVLQ